MEANGIQEVEPRRAVVERVEAPEPVDFVAQAVDPVHEELTEDEGEGELCPEVPIRRPEREADPFGEPRAGSDRGDPHGDLEDPHRQQAGHEEVPDVHAEVAVRMEPAFLPVEEALEAHDHEIGRHRREQDRLGRRGATFDPVDRVRRRTAQTEREERPREPPFDRAHEALTCAFAAGSRVGDVRRHACSLRMDPERV